MDLSRLTKLLALTVSESDGEALNAIRAANAYLKKHSLTWAQITWSTTAAPANRPRSPHQQYRDPFSGIFDEEFMANLREMRWRQAQAEALKQRENEARKSGRVQEAILTDLKLRVSIEHFRELGAQQTVLLLESLRTFYQKNGYLTASNLEVLNKFWNMVKENTK